MKTESKKQIITEDGKNLEALWTYSLFALLVVGFSVMIKIAFI